MLRHLANELGDEWRRLAKCLGIRRVRHHAIIKNNSSSSSSTTADTDTQSQRDAVYDMLSCWMKKMPRAANKVRSQYW